MFFDNLKKYYEDQQAFFWVKLQGEVVSMTSLINCEFDKTLGEFVKLDHIVRWMWYHRVNVLDESKIWITQFVFAILSLWYVNILVSIITLLTIFTTYFDSTMLAGNFTAS